MAKKSKMKNFKNPLKGGSFLEQLLITGLIFFVLITGFNGLMNWSSKTTELPISEVARLVQTGEVKKITVYGSQVEVINSKDEKIITQKDNAAPLEETLSQYGVTAEMLQKVNVAVDNKTFSSYLFALLPVLIPVLLFVSIGLFLVKSLKGAGMQAMSFGQSKAKIIDPKDESQKITFKDVAGAKEAKQELGEIVDFLKNPQKFIEIGAVIPKGVLMIGAP
jgi:cell division protease FtsH